MSKSQVPKLQSKNESNGANSETTIAAQGDSPVAPPKSAEAPSSSGERQVLHPMSRSIPSERQHHDPLCRVVLVEPLIPENTGNISRTCVGTDSELHLVGPMGFEVSEKRVRRAGLDYWDDLTWQQHVCYQDWRASVTDGERIFFIETGGAGTIFDADFERGDILVFGKETTGLLPEWLAAEPDAHAWSIPMPGKVRSLNLSNAVAVTVFELLRQVSAKEKSAPRLAPTKHQP